MNTNNYIRQSAQKYHWIKYYSVMRPVSIGTHPKIGMVWAELYYNRELTPSFGKFHCNVTTGIDGSAIYGGEVYPIAIDEERGKVKILINDREIALFTTLEEITKYGTIE